MHKINISIITMILLCTSLLYGCSNNETTDIGTKDNSDLSSEESTDKNPEEIAANTAQEADTDSSDIYGDLFTQNTISKINIKITDTDWQALLADPLTETYYSADIEINGETIKNVGFRTKGFSSLSSVANSDSDRFGFKVKFDEFVKDQNYNGLNKCVLNASFSDPSYMREFLTYNALSYLDATTPEIEYTQLSINGELYGLYLCVESLDDSFVERVTDTSSKDTCLYKAESESCTLNTDTDVSSFELQYGEDEGNTHISELITELNSMPEGEKGNIETILDVDSVLKAIAVNTVMGNYDSYSGSKAHNYYLLYNNGQFEYLAWDFNMSMGGFSEDSGASVTADVNTAIFNTTLEERPLIKNLLAVPEYKAKYLEYVNSLVEYLGDFEGSVSAVADLIREDVETDPTAFYTSAQFEENIIASDADLSTVVAAVGKDGQGQNPISGKMPNNIERPYGKELPDDAQQPNGQYAPDGMDNPSFEADLYTKGIGGGMINSEAVSIVDYVTQRIANIKEQLSE